MNPLSIILAANYHMAKAWERKAKGQSEVPTKTAQLLVYLAYLGAVLVLCLTGCAGQVAPTSETAEPTQAPAAPLDAPTVVPSLPSQPIQCWRCADRAWRDTCVVPATRAPDAESCLHCGEHCDSNVNP